MEFILLALACYSIFSTVKWRRAEQALVLIGGYLNDIEVPEHDTSEYDLG